MTAITPMLGLKFGRWTVVANAGSDQNGQALWLCRCECGNDGVVVGKKLRNNHSKSCGCLRADVILDNQRMPAPAPPDGPLTQERLKEILHYDPQTGEWRWKQRLAWRIDVGERAGTINQLGYLIITIDGTLYAAHRLAFLYMTGEWPIDEVDHCDLNKANCVWSNLRQSIHQQNCSNVRKRLNNTSGFKGVSRSRNQWAACIRKNGKTIHLGRFDKPEDAAAAYDKAAEQLFGEFHRPSLQN